MARELITFTDLIDVDAVVVQHEHRQRQGELELEQLVESIRQRGLINPIVIDDRNRLVAGERRLEAFRQLGYAEIPFKRSTQLSGLERSLLEYEENAKRKDLTWQENAQAVEGIVLLMKAEEAEVSEEVIALRIGIHYRHLRMIRTVAAEMEQEKVASASNLREAYNFLARQRQRAGVDALNDLINIDRDLAREEVQRSHMALSAPSKGTVVEPTKEPKVELPLPKLDLRTAVVVSREKAEKKVSVRPAEEDLLQEDFLQWLSHRKGSEGKFNLIHCDFPYGKNVHGEDLGRPGLTYGAQMADRVYDDKPEVYFELLEAFVKHFDLFASISCHVVFWYTRENEERTVQGLKQCGLTLYRFPLIWLKSDGKGVCSDPKRTPRHVYETALLGWRGDRNIVKTVADAYSAPTDRVLHPSAKPEPVLRHFFGMLVDHHTTLFDPTCGGGSALRAAESLGAKQVLGLEKDRSFALGAQRELQKFRTLRALD